MELVRQNLEDILASLRALEMDWRDDTAKRVIARLRTMPAKVAYDREDLREILREEFQDGILICRLFLGLSKDSFTSEFAALHEGGFGVKNFKRDPEAFLNTLENMGVLDQMAAEASKEAHWTDVVVERLRSGRGSAITGQKRGRHVEDFAESLVSSVFGNNYQARCNFVGTKGREAKCDFAIPSRTEPRILIESKGYNATGSKQSDVIGDIEAIINAKRPDTSFLLVTDGLSWRQRQSDLRKIIEYQNEGAITRIYTTSMEMQFREDLNTLRNEYKL